MTTITKFPVSQVICHTRVLTISCVCDMIKFGEIKLKSRFKAQIPAIGIRGSTIESVFMSLPFPPIYLELVGDSWLVVDGLKRLRSFYGFLCEGCGLTSTGQYITFDLLSSHLKRKFQESLITVHYLDFNMSEQLKHNIYARLNL